MDTEIKGSNGDLDRGLSLQGSNQSSVRDHNERLILTLLRNVGPKPKAEVARLSGVSPQTASVIMRNLEKRGLIERCAPMRGKVGQPSIPMKLAPDGALFFGLKIGRRSADLVLVDFLGQIIDRRRLTYAFPDPDAALDFVFEGIDHLIGQLNAKQQEIVSGLGVAFPGYMWEWSNIVGAPRDQLDSWRDRDLISEIRDRLEFPVYVQNDASSACGAELVFGHHEHPANFLYFYVGYFIGGGVVINNTLVTGTTGNAGALGPLPVPKKSGGVQQLINVASLSCIEDMIIETGGNSETLWDDPSSWDVDNQILHNWIEQAADGLACAIVASCSVIDFEMVIIDGWLPGEVRRTLIEATREKLLNFDLSGIVQPAILEGTIGADARALGAASLPLSQGFLTPPRIQFGNFDK